MSGGGCVVGSGGGGAAVATGIVLGTELATSTGPVTGTASEVVIEAETTGSCGSIMEPIVGGLTLKLPSPGCLGIVLGALGAAFSRLLFPGDPALSGISLSIGIPGLGAY